MPDQSPKPKFVRIVDGVECISLAEHQHLMAQAGALAQEGAGVLAEHQSNALALFREALAFGLVYGPEIPGHQWDEMREEKAKQLAARLAPLQHGAPKAADAVLEQMPAPAAVGEVTRYGLDSSGRQWHGIHWYDPNVQVAHGTKLYTQAQVQEQAKEPSLSAREDARERILAALTACPHSIAREEVVFKRDSTKDDRHALSQVVDRLEALLPSKASSDLQVELEDARQSLDFYRSRVQTLQRWQSKMRDPERTIVCDIIANGCTLEPAGGRYTVKPAQVPPAWFDWMPKGATHIGKISVTVESGGRLLMRAHAFKYENDVLLVYSTDNDNEYPCWRNAGLVFKHTNFPVFKIDEEEHEPQGFKETVSAARLALEVLQKHRQMRGAYPMEMLGARAVEELEAAFCLLYPD